MTFNRTSCTRLHIWLYVGLAALCQSNQALAAESSLSVTVTAVQPQTEYQAARLYSGNIKAARSSELGFKFGGTVAKVEVALGAQVANGTLLASLDTASAQAALSQTKADVSLAAANLEAVQAELQLAQQTEQRFRDLRAKGHVAKQTYEEQQLSLRAKTAQRSVAAAQLQRAEAGRLTAAVALRESQIRAPYAGRIQTRYVDEGSQVAPGQPILRIIEIGKLEAHIGIPQKVAASMQAGDTHNIVWSGQALPAKLMTLLPEIDPNTRTQTAVYQLEQSTLPIGAVVELQLDQAIVEPGYWVPLAALTESERGLWGLYVVNSEQTVERRLIEVLHSNDVQAFVRGTLQPNDQVISTGVHRVVPGQQVRVAPARMTPVKVNPGPQDAISPISLAPTR